MEFKKDISISSGLFFFSHFHFRYQNSCTVSILNTHQCGTNNRNVKIFDIVWCKVNFFHCDIFSSYCHKMATSMLVNPWSTNTTNFRYDQRHYKKDSRFVLDLYTLTYDSHESLDCHGVANNNVSSYFQFTQILLYSIILFVFIT